MQASKEQAAKAMKVVKNAPNFEGNRFLIDFLEAAHRKLPSEAAFEWERKRVRKPA